MKVFISWSGDEGKSIAQFLRDWLPGVLQNVKPFMSSEDIDKGARWGVDIATQLEETSYGIVCVTPDSVVAPWILFESGALSKSLKSARVSPIVFDLVPSDLRGSPLLEFQITQFVKDDVHKLMDSINKSAVEAERISSELLAKAFDRVWTEFDSFVKQLTLSKQPHVKPQPATASAASLPKAIGDAIQEILANSRSGLKLLNSPATLLPENYLREVFRINNLPVRMADFNANAWDDVDDALQKSTRLIAVHAQSAKRSLDFIGNVESEANVRRLREQQIEAMKTIELEEAINRCFQLFRKLRQEYVQR